MNYFRVLILPLRSDNSLIWELDSLLLQACKDF